MKPAHETQLTGDQFFLTRQTANLMEDFVREISDSSSLFLLYGKPSVGKSWLLRELSSRRIRNRNICWIDFKSGEIGTQSEGKTSDLKRGKDASEIQGLMEAADDGQIIFVDHFEDASNKARHQLFQSWLTDGIDKNFNLVIAASSDSFNEVRQLAQQNQIEIKSFQLLPYNAAETEAFVGFYLFPLNPLIPLSIPAEVKKQIKNCKGIVGKIAAVASQQKFQITQEIESEATTRSSVSVALLIAILVVVGGAYWYLQPATQKQLISTQESKIGPYVASDSSLTEAVNTDVIGPTNKVESDVIEPTDSAGIDVIGPTNTADTIEPIAESPVEPEQDKLLLSNQSQADTELVETEMPVEPGVSKPSAAETPVETGVSKQPSAGTELIEKLLAYSETQYSSRFQQELASSLDWIEQNDKDRATIQIMSLTFGKLTDNTYYRYIDKLKKQGIDVSQIRIYPTRINGSVIYGVVYGDYENRKEARKQIQQLPESLTSSGPLTRTIGGIWNEINR